MKRQLHIRLSNDLLAWIKAEAKTQESSLNNFIVRQLLNIKLQGETNANSGTKDSHSVPPK